MKKVFISYAREDIEVAKKLYHDLKDAGLDPWMESEDLLPGTRLETVRSQIKKSEFFLALVSEYSMSERGTVHSQIKLAQKILEEFPRSGIFIIPVRLDDCTTDYETLEGLRPVDLFLSYEDGFRDILRVFRSDMKSAKPSETPGIFQLNPDRKRKESRSDSSGYALLAFLCLVSIALAVTVILFVFFPIRVKGENVLEQAVPVVLCASVFCAVLLTLAKVYKSVAFKTVIILLVPLCISFSVVSSAFILDISPLETIRVIMTLDIEREDKNIPESPVKPEPDEGLTPDTERDGTDEAVSKPETDKTGIPENGKSQGTESVQQEAVTGTEEKQKHVGDGGSDAQGISEPEYRLRSKSGTLTTDDVKAMLKKYSFYDRRWNKSGDFTNNFKDNGDGTVTDSVTGLMWQKSGSDSYMKYDKAQAYIDGLNRDKFAGYNDWRLPTLEELASLLENKEVDDLFIDPLFDRKQRWCWTADKKASGGAWLVYFYFGSVNRLYLVNSYYVRAVRSRTIDY
ncbi:MAG: DUF1566 domain-containing protein [Desulfobacterales bacterium]|nr:DUF1566 domain-containing protein [Desulfobacterales bacterium]